MSRCQRLQFPWEGFKCGSYCIAFIRFCYETEWLTLWSQSVLSLGQQVYSKLNGMIEQSWHIVHRREPLKGAFDRTRSGRLGQSITRLVTERVDQHSQPGASSVNKNCKFNPFQYLSLIAIDIRNNREVAVLRQQTSSRGYQRTSQNWLKVYF